MARFGSFPNRAIHTGIGRPIWPANAVIESAIVALSTTGLAGQIGPANARLLVARGKRTHAQQARRRDDVDI